MKLSLLILFTGIFLSHSAFAENAIATGGAPEELPEDLGAKGSIGVTQEDLEFILESSDVKAKYEACKTEKGETTLSPAVSDCLWEVDPQKPELALTAEEKTKIADQIDNLGGADNAEASKLKFESLDKGFLKQVNQEPSFVALQNHMKKKLEETIYGDGKDKKLSVADHTTFHKLYKSQLTKNVIQAMSSYCLDANPNDDFLIDETNLADQRKKNIANLANATAKEVDIDPNDPSKGKEKQLTSEANFNSCISALGSICYTNGTYSSIPGGTDATKKINYSYSKTRACNVVTYIKQLKQNIIAVNDIETKLEALNKESGESGFDGNGVENLGRPYVQDSNESLTVMSSKEFVEESGFKDAVDTEVSDFENCFKDDAVADEEACKKYLSDKKKENAKLIAEADTRSRALEEKMKQSFAADKDGGVRSYLKDQAFTEDEIEALISKKGIDQVATDIEARYKAEREAYITTLAERIKGKTKDDDDILKGQNTTRLEDIRDELTSKTKRYTELIHFTNVVSGYLKVSGTDSSNQATAGRNTTALAIELGDSAYDPNASGASGAGRGTASNGDGASTHSEGIKAAAEAVGVKPVVEENKDSSISAKSINDILSY